MTPVLGRSNMHGIAHHAQHRGFAELFNNDDGRWLRIVINYMRVPPPTAADAYGPRERDLRYRSVCISYILETALLKANFSSMPPRWCMAANRNEPSSAYLIKALRLMRPSIHHITISISDDRQQESTRGTVEGTCRHAGHHHNALPGAGCEMDSSTHYNAARGSLAIGPALIPFFVDATGATPPSPRTSRRRPPPVPMKKQPGGHNI